MGREEPGFRQVRLSTEDIDALVVDMAHSPELTLERAKEKRDVFNKGPGIPSTLVVHTLRTIDVDLPHPAHWWAVPRLVAGCMPVQGCLQPSSHYLGTEWARRGEVWYYFVYACKSPFRFDVPATREDAQGSSTRWCLPSSAA